MRGANKLPAHADLFAPQAASQEQLSSPSPPQSTVKAQESAACLPQGARKAAAHTAANPSAFPVICSPPGSTCWAQPLQCLASVARNCSSVWACPSPQPQGCPGAVHGVTPKEEGTGI